MMHTRKVKQYTDLEITGEQGRRYCCTLHYTSEVAYSCNTIQDVTKDVVPFQNIALLPYIHEWGHAQMNIKCPLRKLGRNSCVDENYWNV